MAEPCHFASTPRTPGAKVRVAELAERQWGVVTRAQLEEVGLGSAGVTRWIGERRLHRIYPGVYAVGHLALGTESKMAAALFYAGPGAALSHVTAGWWWGMLTTEPRRLHICVPSRRHSIRQVRVHQRKHPHRVWHKRFPLTPPAQTLLDIAGVVRLMELRRALAEAEYRRLVTLAEVEAVLGRGKPGSAALRAALDCHRPQLAHTRSRMEERFVLLCERDSLTPPAVNARVAGWTVDAVWFDLRIAVELDSHAAHGTPAAMEEDRRRDLELRAAGYTVLRYTWRQLTDEWDLVGADLRRNGVGNSESTAKVARNCERKRFFRAPASGAGGRGMW
jgi:predicted transcriptional regulator of viral defense system